MSCIAHEHSQSPKPSLFHFLSIIGNHIKKDSRGLGLNQQHSTSVHLGRMTKLNLQELKKNVLSYRDAGVFITDNICYLTELLLTNSARNGERMNDQ